MSDFQEVSIPYVAKRQISEVQIEHLKKAREQKKRLREEREKEKERERELAMSNANNDIASVHYQVADLKNQLENLKQHVGIDTSDGGKTSVSRVNTQVLDSLSDDDILPPNPKRSKIPQNTPNNGTSTATKIFGGVIATSMVMLGAYSVYNSGVGGHDILGYVSSLGGGETEPPPWTVFHGDLYGNVSKQSPNDAKLRSSLRVAEY